MDRIQDTINEIIERYKQGEISLEVATRQITFLNRVRASMIADEKQNRLRSAA
jgi:hypothetical protein